MMVMVAGIGVCLCFILYFIRCMIDPEFGYGTVFSPQFSESGFNRLRVGMSEEDVEAIMGPPLKKVNWSGATYPVAGGDENWMYSEPCDSGSYWRRWVVFGNGKVVAIVQIWYDD